MAESMHIRYAKAFSNLSLGRALYHPCPKSTLHLGLLGYFDRQGDWHTIVNLIDMDLSSAPPNLKLTTLGQIPSTSPVSISRWDPICSRSVEYEKLENSAKAGTPAFSGREGFKFTKTTDFGAVLVTQGDVKEEYYSDDTPLHRWIDDNFKALSDNYSELIQQNVPLWIITKIYYTQKCSIWCWDGEQEVVSLEFGVKTVPAGGDNEGTAGYSASSVTTTGPGWTHYGEPPASNESATAHKDDFVLFVGGLQITADTGFFGEQKDEPKVIVRQTHRPKEAEE